MTEDKEKNSEDCSPLVEPASEEQGKLSPNYVVMCLIGYSMAFIVFGSQVSILGPTIRPLSEQLNVDEPSLSPLFTALGVSCIISGTPSGWLVDAMPTHHVLIGSLLVQGIGFSLVPFMQSVWSLTALWFVICFSYNFTNSAVFTSLTWMFPGQAGGSLNLVLAMFGIGSFLIPLAAFQCRIYLGTEVAVFWLVGGMSLLSTIPFFFVASPKRPNFGGGDGHQTMKPRSHQGLATIVTYSMVLLVFLSTTAETSVGNWINTYSQSVVGLEKADAAWTNAAFWGFFTIGRVVGAFISHLSTPACLLLCFTPLSVLGTAIPMLISLWGLEMTKSWVLAMAILAGMGNSAGYANAIALMERYVPVTGAINGLFGAVAGGACMVGPNLVALFASLYGTKSETGEVQFWYQAMAWVGLFFYAMHFPTIITCVIAGNRLRRLTIEEADLEEPLLGDGTGATAPQDIAAGGEGVSVRSNRSHRYSPASHLPIYPYDGDNDTSAHGISSFPGHIPTVGSLGSGGGSLSASLRSNSLLASTMARTASGQMSAGTSSVLGGRTPVNRNTLG